ncbi:MAG TPA: glycosyltransferase family 39 protein [Gemmatimonadaceae bacterium]
MSLPGELRAFWRAEARDHRIALVVIVIAGVILRLLTLSQPMRYDESVTYLEFVRHPLAQALSRYDYPNNHLFHTLLAKASVAAFGNQPWALRLPAFVAGVCIVPLSYAVARVLYGGRPAVLAAGLVASSGVLALYSTNARGYSILILLFLILVLVAARIIAAATRTLWLTFAVVAALGVWTIPVMLYPLGAVSLWLGLSLLTSGRRRELPWLAGALALGAALTVLAYGPVFSHAGLAAVTRNGFVASTEWTKFLGDLAIAAWDTLMSWGLGLPPLVSAMLLAAAVIALARHERVSRFAVGLPLAAFVWDAWLLMVTHRAPFPRIWLWCVPVALAVAGAGIVDVVDRSRRLALLKPRIPMLAALASLVFAASVALSGAVLLTRDTGTFVDAEATATQLSHLLRPGDRVLAVIPTNGPLAYYLDRLGVDSSYMKTDESLAKRLIVVVNEGEEETVQDVLRYPDASDSNKFAASLIAQRPLSKVYLLERRDAPH